MANTGNITASLLESLPSVAVILALATFVVSSQRSELGNTGDNAWNIVTERLWCCLQYASNQPLTQFHVGFFQNHKETLAGDSIFGLSRYTNRYRLIRSRLQ